MFVGQQLTISNPVRRVGGAGGGGDGLWYARWRRNYSGAGAGGTMISAKFRLKEERRRVLKLSAWKLRGVEDKESCLRRSVLIHNTLRRLQKPSGATSRAPSHPTPRPPTPLVRLPPSTLDEDDDDDGKTHAATAAADECDVQDVLSQLCGPPTPRLLTTIDEECSFESLSQPPPAKRRRLSDGSATHAPAAPPDADDSDSDSDSSDEAEAFSPPEAEVDNVFIPDVISTGEASLDEDDDDDSSSSQMSAALWSSSSGPPSPPSSPPPPLTCARSASLLADGSAASTFGGLVASVES